MACLSVAIEARRSRSPLQQNRGIESLRMG